MREWVVKEQNKHPRCACGCGGEIKNNESLLDFTDDIYSEDKRSEIISIFRNYVLLNEDYKTSFNSSKPPKYPHVTGDYVEYFLHPSLDAAQEIICSEKDEELLLEFFKVIFSSTNSADETPSYILKDIYLCMPNIFVFRFEEFNEKERMIIYENIARFRGELGDKINLIEELIPTDKRIRY